MLKSKKRNNRKTRINQGKNEQRDKAKKIGASTPYSQCSEKITAFGGLLALEKFIDLVDFRGLFENIFIKPARKLKLGNYKMLYGLLMLLHIGFTRIGHFEYIRQDPMICGLLGVNKLPVVSTFWRYLNSLTINQSKSILKLISSLRERVWKLCNIEYRYINIDIDTTVETVYGEAEGARKGHNIRHRGKEGYRPVLMFIEQTREYICGKLRSGVTMCGDEVNEMINSIKNYLPACVKRVLIRGDGEFISWESVKACEQNGYQYIFGNKRANPQFKSRGWYKHGEYEYNSCMHKPAGWGKPCRFVAMRIIKKEKEKQLNLFEDDNYKYRIFVTNLKKKAHKVIRKYDKRADIENLIAEAHKEGLSAIPSSKFKNNYAYFQIVMLSINIWRYLKLLNGRAKTSKEENLVAAPIVRSTIRIARLRQLFLPAKIVAPGNQTTVKYSYHDSRSEGAIEFLRYLDKRRKEPRQWLTQDARKCRQQAA